MENNNFIFVSYAHLDNEVVLPIIKKLQERFNVWYDKGIKLGKEWDKEILDHLETCSLFVYMVSKQSLASENCKDEIAYAKDNKIPFINILVENVELPKLFKLRYGRFQMCYLEKYQSLDDLLDEIDKSARAFNVDVYKKTLHFSKLDKVLKKDGMSSNKTVDVGLDQEKPENNVEYIFEDDFGDEEKVETTPEKTNKKAVDQVDNKAASNSKEDVENDTEPPKEIKYDKKLFTIINGKLVKYNGQDKNSIVTIPALVKEIAPNVFKNKKSITKVVIPSSVEIIGNSAFSGCTNLKNVVLSECLKKINASAFENCSSLSNISILPSTLKSISSKAFISCTALKAINVSPDNKDFCSLDGILYSKNLTTLFACPPGRTKKVEIPSETLNISPFAFYDSQIDRISFAKDSKLMNIGIYSFANSWIKAIVIPKSVNKIDPNTFLGCRKLVKVKLYTGIKLIDEQAFRECDSLSEINIPRSLTFIGRFAFAYCSSLKSIYLPNSVDTIQDAAFYDDFNLVIYAEAKSRLPSWSNYFNDTSKFLRKVKVKWNQKL